MLLPGQGNFCYEFALSGDPEAMCVNFGFDPDGGAWSGSVDDANTAFEVFEATFLEEMSTNYDLVRCLMQLGTIGGTIEFASTNAPSGGAKGAEPMVQNTSVLVHKYTADAGRGRYGRCYIPGVVEADVAPNGQLLTTPLADWQAQAVEFFEAFDGSALPFLTVNHGAGWLGSIPSLVTSLSVDGVCATQRRRLRR